MPDGDSPTAAVALASCPLCQTSHVASALEDHLRTAHRLVTYKGVRRSLDDAVAALLSDLLSPHPDDAAWLTLARLARSEHGPDADRFLADRLTEGLSRLGEPRRDAVASALGGVIAPGNTSLVLLLAQTKSPAARRLALACLGQLPPPYGRYVRLALRDLVADPALPGRARFATLAFVLPGLEERRAARILGRLISGQRRSRAVEFLQRLEGRTGPLPVYGPLLAKLEDRVWMSCPRCGVELRRYAMIGHLWEEHHLLLEGKRVRDPWGVVEEWLTFAKEHHDPKWVERSRVAAEKIDPQHGRYRLNRLLLSRGLGDNPTKLALLAEAREQHAGLCPSCFAFVPVPPEEPSAVVKLTSERLVGAGFRVAISEKGPRPWAEVVTPTTVIFQGQEPDRAFTPDGAAFLYAGILVLAAILCAMLWPISLGHPVRPVAMILLAATIVHIVTRKLMEAEGPVNERVLDLTWSLLVPQLHSGEFRPVDSAFAAGLARWYSERLSRADSSARRLEVPAEPLAELIRQTELAVAAGKAPVGHLAALMRLNIERAHGEGKDAVWLTVRQLARCFEGKLPMTYAQHLLEGWSGGPWTRVNLSRLRVLVCDRAFEAGYEVQTLLDAGQNAPALGAILAIDAPHSLAALRLVWSLRATRPWDKFGDVVTAFQIAADPERANVFSEHADVLLYQEERDVEVGVEGEREPPGPARVQVTLAGVWLQSVIFSIPPRVFEVRRRTSGTELILGRHVFRSPGDLEGLSRRVEKWFRWVFHELLPQVDKVLTWQSPHRQALLRAWGAVPCPECGKALLPRVGEVGIALEEKAEG
jgi:predicted RNA-binding Zn-ribbon protein involved in translation (DUF1610 family)